MPLHICWNKWLSDLQIFFITQGDRFYGNSIFLWSRVEAVYVLGFIFSSVTQTLLRAYPQSDVPGTLFLSPTAVVTQGDGLHS